MILLCAEALHGSRPCRTAGRMHYPQGGSPVVSAGEHAKTRRTHHLLLRLTRERSLPATGARSSGELLPVLDEHLGLLDYRP
jgi:hypothetical protein